MTAIDLVFGFLAGVVSCVTAEALLLFPVVLASAGATGRTRVIALAVGLGLSLVVTGIAAGTFGSLLGVEAIWFRRLVCVLLGLLGFMLMSASMIERHPRLTGGIGGVFGAADSTTLGSAFRLLLLALLLGANWSPTVGPTLGKASLMAADTWNFPLALVVLFAFGAGAAAPWIVLGRIVSLVVRPFAAGLVHGVAGKRLLGLALLAVAVLGATGLDLKMVHALDALLPAWSKKLAVTF